MFPEGTMPSPKPILTNLKWGILASHGFPEMAIRDEFNNYLFVTIAASYLPGIS